ncbi:MAG: monovalent cation/H(+) antiporter subunit G [Myxococcota bacterium]|nr:monovalent cation/H(+) antiporter subunit G [Myxococcota bacterium]
MAIVREWIVSALVLGGALFMLIAAIGVLRLPDLFTRMQAATKAGAVGLVGIVGAVALSLQRGEVTVLALLLMAFVVMTAPVAAHTIARAGYLNRVPLWKGTQRDDLLTSGALDAIFEAARGDARVEKRSAERS